MAKYVEYELNENEIIRIPQEDIDRLMKLPDIKSVDDACWVWCEDNGKVLNEEQEELDKKAKANRITATIHQAKAKTQKERKKLNEKPTKPKIV